MPNIPIDVTNDRGFKQLESELPEDFEQLAREHKTLLVLKLLLGLRLRLPTAMPPGVVPSALKPRLGRLNRGMQDVE